FMAREAVDKHLEVAGALIDPKKGPQEKLEALVSSGAFYAAWYPTRWFGRGHWPRFDEFGSMARHLRFCERSTRKLAREIFHGMMVHQAKMQHKQAFLFRVVDIANEIFAMTAAVCRAHAMAEAGIPEARSAMRLADLFCRTSRRKVRRFFADLWSNDDTLKYKVGVSVLNGEHLWLESVLRGLADTHAKKAAAAAKSAGSKAAKVAVAN